MKTVNVQINITSATGMRLVREMEKHPKVAKVEYPLPEGLEDQKTYTLEESYQECCQILNEHYKVDVHKL
jgi:O-acetylhomoserine/O-acetylserine sulfhydrylase-like pyridoxal-dependent enzyme